MDLSSFVILSTDGTFLGANSCFLIDTNKLSEEELELLNEGSDSDRYDLCDKGIDLEQIITVNMIS